MPIHAPSPLRTDRPSRAPGGSLLFEKLIPALFIALGIITLALILFAAGVLLGIVRF